MMGEFLIRRPDLAALLDHARRGYPDEVCGLIGGRIRRRLAYAESVIPVPNIAPRPGIRFEMAHTAMVRAIFDLRRRGQEVVAVYHSHPQGAAQPSETDIIEASWPDAVYLILGFVRTELPEIRAWSIRRGQAKPVLLRILEATG